MDDNDRVVGNGLHHHYLLAAAYLCLALISGLGTISLEAPVMWPLNHCFPWQCHFCQTPAGEETAVSGTGMPPPGRYGR